MEHIMIDSSKSNVNTLAVYIDGLVAEKQYEEFRFKIADGDWVNINFVAGNTQTEVAVITDLQPYTKHNIKAQYKQDGQWYDIPDTTFVTCLSLADLNIPVPQNIGVTGSNALSPLPRPNKVSVLLTKL